jgi:FdhD protein
MTEAAKPKSRRPPALSIEAGLSVVTVDARARDGAHAERPDPVVVEEPLEIRISGETFATTMRTPGQDQELVAGFLVGEGLVRQRSELSGIAHCGRIGEPDALNVIDVTPAPGVRLEEALDGARRALTITASCGVCGRRNIDDLLTSTARLEDPCRFRAQVLADLVERLRAEQPNFARTGGIHAAGIATAAGDYRVVREDIGRHNATDKAIGRLFLEDALPAREMVLVVSGRASFEIVAKALRAGIPAVVSVSAPSSLAIATAARGGITLVGFARGGAFNVYSGVERIEW